MNPTISRLPVELFSLILNWVQASYIGFRHNSHMEVAHTCASVCRAWRAMVLSDCTLWQNIEIPVVDGLPSALVVLWLQRSGRSQLHLKFSDRNSSSYNADFRLFRSIMVLLHAEVSRWRSLDIDVEDGLNFDILIAPYLFGTATSLESFSIDTHGPNVLCWATKFICPNIRILSLDSNIVHAIAMDPRPQSLRNANALHSLTVDYRAPLGTDADVSSALLDVSSVAARCTFLSLRGFRMSTDLALTSPGLLVLPSLVRLTFNIAHPRLVIYFLQVLRASSLMEVALINMISDQSDNNLISDIRINSLHLTRIAGSYTLRTFRSYLLDCDHLVVTSTPSFNDALLALMSNNHSQLSNGRWICPHLVAIEIVTCQDVSDIYLRCLINSRINASTKSGSVTAIKQLVVYGTNPISDDNWKWFSENLEYFKWEYYNP